MANPRVAPARAATLILEAVAFFKTADNIVNTTIEGKRQRKECVLLAAFEVRRVANDKHNPARASESDEKKQ